MADFFTNTQIHEHTLIRAIFALLIIQLCLTGQSQGSLSSENKKALKLYKKGMNAAGERDFESALVFFSKTIKADPGFYEAYLRRASLFDAMGNEDSLYANFSKYLNKTNRPAPSVLERTARLSFNRGHYRESEEYLEQLLILQPELEEEREMALLKESLVFANSEIKKDSTLVIAPLPKTVNRFAVQYLPAMTIDKSQLFFTKRDDISGDEDIVVSNFENGEWGRAESISPKINTSLNEGACSISADGRTLIFTSCDKTDSYGSCDLYITKRSGSSWPTPKNIGRPINSKYWESQPSLSADGKTLFFSSNRPGGFGMRDLWVSFNEDGEWSKPVNLGKDLNTFKDETTPFIHPNGETLYFSSNGHVGMGGFDLYKSQLVDSLWIEIKNLGFPINGFKDEVALLIEGEGKSAIFAKEAQRNKQILESTIVRFELEKDLQAKPTTYIVGQVVDDRSGLPLKAKIEVYDLNEGLLLYDALSDSVNGQYVMVLPSDKELGCFVKKKGYLFYEHNFYSGPNSFTKPDSMEIRLKPVEINQTVVLKNIYFDLDSYELKAKSKVEIRNVVDIIDQNPGIKVEISGHTDNQGPKNYNQELSEKRAKSVYDELLKFGIDKESLTYMGYADNRPISSNKNEEGRRSNRRIEFRVLYLEP